MTLTWLLLLAATSTAVTSDTGGGEQRPAAWHIAAILPARATSTCHADSGGGVGTSVEGAAARAAVALDWALHAVSPRWPWPALRLRLLDTCGWRARAAAQAAALAQGAGSDGAVLAAVSWALPPTHAVTVDDVLAAGDLAALAPARANPAPPGVFALQVQPGPSASAAAVLALLRHLGWSLVSAAAAPDPAAQAGLRAFRAAASAPATAANPGVSSVASHVCIAVEADIGHTELEADAALAALVGARAAGARAVLLWAGAAAASRLLRAAERALGLGALQPEELFWLAVEPAGAAPAAVPAARPLRRAARALGGVLLFRPEQQGVPPFSEHLRELRRQGATRRRDDLSDAEDTANDNVDVSIEEEDEDVESAELLRTSYQQVLSQRADDSDDSRADFSAVQTALVLRASAARLRAELCPDAALDAHLACTHNLTMSELRNRFHELIREAQVPRADAPFDFSSTAGAASHSVGGGAFAFDASGAGNLSVEILNLRRKPRDRGQPAGEAAFERVGVFSAARGLQVTGRLLLYRGSGEAVPAESLSSQCTSGAEEGGGCERCGAGGSALATGGVVGGGVARVGSGSGARASAGAWSGGARAEVGPPDAPLRLLAVLPVREASPGMRCGAHVAPEAVEQAEALLWAVDQVNQNMSAGGAPLALTVVDSCGSGARAARLVADALAPASPMAGVGAKSTIGEVVAVLVGGDDEHVAEALDIAGRLKVPALALSARGPAPERRAFAPFPLTLAPSHAALAAAALALLRRLRWRCFGVVYMRDAHHFEHVYRLVERGSTGARGSPRLARALPLPAQRSSWPRTLATELRGWGARAGASPAPVLLLLPAIASEAVLRAARALELQGEVAPGAFEWLLLDDGAEAHLATYPEQAFGALVARPAAGRVECFEQYLRSLRLDSGDARDPWLPAFWSAVFHCRGAACSSPLYASLETYSLRQNAAVVNAINSVLTVSHALNTVRRKLCPELSRAGVGAGGGGSDGIGSAAETCVTARDGARARQLLWEVAPRMAFVGAGLNAVAFSERGENLHSDIEIINYQRAAGGELLAVAVGRTTLASGNSHGPSTGGERDFGVGGSAMLNLRLDTGRVRVYAAGRRAELAAAAAAPACPGGVPPSGGGATSGHGPRAIELASARGASRLRLLAVVPAHARAHGAGWLACGALRPDAALLAAAAAFALDSAANSSTTPAATLGALLLDTCEQAARAFSSVYGVLDMAAEEGADEPVAALLLEPPEPAPPLLDLLESQQLALFQLAPAGSSPQPPALPAMKHMAPLLNGEAFVSAALALVRARGSHSVLVVRGEGAWAAAAAGALQHHAAAHRDLCVAGVYVLHRRTPDLPSSAAAATATAFRDIADAREVTRRLRPGTTALLLLERAADVRLFLSLCDGLEGLTFLAALQPADVPALAEYPSVLALTPAAAPPDASFAATRQGFATWMRAALSPASPRALFPAPWLAELRQALCDGSSGTGPSADALSAPAPTAASAATLPPPPQPLECPRLQMHIDTHADALRFAMGAARAAARGLHAFATEHCKNSGGSSSSSNNGGAAGGGAGARAAASGLPMEVASLRDCGDASAQGQLRMRLRDALERAALETLYVNGSFHVWSGNRRVGAWSAGIGLTLDGWSELAGRATAACSAMECTACAGETPETSGAGADIQPPSVYHTLQHAWASALGGATLFGALLTALTALYFLAAAALPRANLAGGTSPLGYLILLGLLLLFAGNLSFVLAPTVATCGARRFVPPIAYALIFSGMLLKVFTTWQLANAGESAIAGVVPGLVLTRPAVLITAACGLTSVQALVSGGWLLLLPPRAVPLTEIDTQDAAMSAAEAQRAQVHTHWRCYPHGPLEAHLLLSMAYSMLLLVACALVAFLCSRRRHKRRPDDWELLRGEARWILCGALLAGFALLSWGIAAGALLAPERADLSSALAHLLAANAVLLCLYVPKVLLYTRLRAAQPSDASSGPPVFDVSQFQPQPIKTLPGLLAMPQMMGLGPELRTPSVEEEEDDDDDDPTQEVPGALYENMFCPGPPASSQAAGSCTGSLYAEDFEEEDDEEEEDMKGQHCEPGTNEFTAKLSNILVVDGDQLSFQEGISHM